MKLSLLKVAPSLLSIAAMLACGSDSTAPRATVAGSYSATEFTTTGSSGQTNQIQAGSTVFLNLSGNGTLSGHLHLAATNFNPVFDADMAGTWTQVGSTVTFSQTADTFIRDMTFDVVANGNRWQLLGSQVFSGTEVKIKLDQLSGID